MNQIDKLTPEPEPLILDYQEKWIKIGLSTEPIDREKAAETIKEAYGLINLPEQKILFFDNIFASVDALNEEQSVYLRDDFYEKLHEPLINQIESQLERGRIGDFCGVIVHRDLYFQLWSALENELENLEHDLYFILEDCIPYRWIGYASDFDFLISVLKCSYNQRQWAVYQSLVKDCGFIFPCRKTCIISERPIKLSFDNQQRLHAEGEPALQFADGYSLYSYHGVTLPEKYGKLHPHEWQAKWLLEEDNAEVRRVLIQGIGYRRILEQLQATELDSWREYTLLKMNSDVDVEPIYLLKMTCPSTGFIYVLRVPPDMSSAREAICWVNWGVDPNDFALAT